VAKLKAKAIKVVRVRVRKAHSLAKATKAVLALGKAGRLRIPTAQGGNQAALLIPIQVEVSPLGHKKAFLRLSWDD